MDDLGLPAAPTLGTRFDKFCQREMGRWGPGFVVSEAMSFGLAVVDRTDIINDHVHDQYSA